MPPTALSTWLHVAGQQPILQAVAVIAGTFVLEDAATIVAAAQAQAGNMSVALALCSLYVGIVLGDLGLYGLGALAARVPWARRWAASDRLLQGRDWLSTHVFRVVLVSRFLPGTRLPVYTACGFLGADLRRFALAAVVATMAWTSLLFAVSMEVGDLLLRLLGPWRWAGIAGFVVVVLLAGRRLARLQAGRVPRP